jgi:enoyl-CoA hydratase/carnithine racemase
MRRGGRCLPPLRRDDDGARVIVTGAGSAFCAGGDLKGMRDKHRHHGGEDRRGDPRELPRGIQRIPLALYEMDVPTIAAVNGPAIGAGLDLACMCDIRVASEKALLRRSFVKVGIVPGDGGAYLLPKVVGMSKALEMSLTGDAIGAGRGAGLRPRLPVVAPDKLLEPRGRWRARSRRTRRRRCG